jgi:MscS family membrane protein
MSSGGLGFQLPEELLPSILVDISLWEIRLWQWVALLALVFIATLVSWLVATLIVRVAQRLVEDAKARQHLVDLITGPIRLLLGLSIYYLGSLALRLSPPAQDFIGGAVRSLVIVAVTWLLARIVDVASRVLQERLVEQGQESALGLLPLGRKTVKVFLVIVAFIALLQNLGFNVTGLIAGLGVGGIAVALAAQRTLENLFGAITLSLDQPVRVGDFCRFGDKIGTVEEIGLRSTRIRTLERTVVSVPNSEFATLQLENFARRDAIWFHPKIGLRYETSADQLRYVLIEIKKMLLAHPKVSPDPARVRFTGFGAYSLDLDIFAYIETSDINEFLAVQEDLLLRIMDIVEAAGSTFAFPSQTAYVGKDEGLDPDKTRAAEERVRSWRNANRLYLPDYPPQEASAIADTLDYPPKGSPGAKSHRGS